MNIIIGLALIMFPSPREVNRFISIEQKMGLALMGLLPSPLEVNMFISVKLNFHQSTIQMSYRPLSR